MDLSTITKALEEGQRRYNLFIKPQQPITEEKKEIISANQTLAKKVIESLFIFVFVVVFIFFCTFFSLDGTIFQRAFFAFNIAWWTKIFYNYNTFVGLLEYYTTF